MPSKTFSVCIIWRISRQTALFLSLLFILKHLDDLRNSWVADNQEKSMINLPS